jgi:hypothetical protein
MGLRPETAPKCAFYFLFSPNDDVKKAMSKEFSILKSNDILKISINIRVGDPVFDPEYDQRTTKLDIYEPYFICASNIESFARLPNQRVIWYLTSDSLRLRQLAKQKYGEKVLTEENLRYVHGDCGDFRLEKVSSKFGVYKFLVFSEFQLVTACLLFLSITSRVNMVRSLYLHSRKIRETEACGRNSLKNRNL